MYKIYSKHFKFCYLGNNEYVFYVCMFFKYKCKHLFVLSDFYFVIVFFCFILKDYVMYFYKINSCVFD